MARPGWMSSSAEWFARGVRLRGISSSRGGLYIKCGSPVDMCLEVATASLRSTGKKTVQTQSHKRERRDRREVTHGRA